MDIPKIVLNERYHLGQLLGRGGFARVYLATDLRLRRQIAIKVLDNDLIDSAQHKDFLTRFEREAQAVAALDHPNILSIYDSGESGDTFYLVMPYIRGGSLDTRLHREGRFSLQQIDSWVQQASAALVHRSSMAV